ncbi:hypothetical protein PUR29_35815 [Methylobacterium ajmalii]|uniref:Uncharacterized protein n=1 Tax=Methylobacterium ajmalii TaxID=2738439 RepID=A0ABV0A5C9_9HYPH|nr:hypothetical protein [uncultured Methylobacterium sp.]
MTGRLGHNGGPALEEPTDTRSGRCKHCRHWKAPSDEEQRAYEWFHLGLSRRRVRRATGACDRVLIGNNPRPAFSATSGEFGCGNFEAAPLPPMPKGGGYVTIWQGGRIVWEGHEEAIPARFLQEDLDL